MPMKPQDVRAALAAGHRKFILIYSDDVIVVKAYGHSWIKYTAPYLKFFLSTNMRLFAAAVERIHIETEKSPDSAAGQKDEYPQPNYNT